MYAWWIKSGFKNFTKYSRYSPTNRDQGLLCDLLWSDPDKEAVDFDENDRGVSVIFCEKVDTDL